MATRQRSTTGCTLCKTRRKKCDETKPQCRRCLAFGGSCTYEYVEQPKGERYRIKRTRPAPRIAPGKNTLTSVPDVNLASSSMTAIYEAPNPLATSNIFELRSDVADLNSGLVTPQRLFNSVSLSPDFPITLQLDSSPISYLPNSLELVPVVADSTSEERKILWDDDDDDPEGVRLLLYTTPTLDKNVKDNALPFVLHCYSQWALVRVFEPLKLVHMMRDQVMTQFSSETTRTRTILIANVMDMFAKKLTIDGTRRSILNHLVLDVQLSGSFFATTLPSELDRQNAMRTLDSMLEIFSLQVATQSISACLQSLDYAAAVFRRACSEPVNPADIVLQSDLNLRHFSIVDIIQSVTTGLPTYIQYEVPFSLELCERIYRVQNSIGLQWLHGFPDQFILLFAWIISLCKTPEAGNNMAVVAWIETNLPRIRIAIDESGDPLLRIGRMVVQECWRFAVLIYLYMVLCGANAQDPRVVRAQKGFMRLVRGVKSRRNPDAYLFTPMVIAGVATTEKQDQETVRQRILGVNEYAEPGTVGNDVMLELEDVWARTRDEGRPAVWSDLRIACFRVTGR